MANVLKFKATEVRRLKKFWHFPPHVQQRLKKRRQEPGRNRRFFTGWATEGNVKPFSVNKSTACDGGHLTYYFQEIWNLCSCTKFPNFYVYFYTLTFELSLLLVLLKYKMCQHFLSHPVVYIRMSHRQEWGQSHNIKTDNKSFEYLAKIPYLGTWLTNENVIRK
jgi:hypothetical protein